MSLPIESEVQTVLEPFNGRIRNVLDKAFKDFVEKRNANIFKRTDSVDQFDGVIRAAIAEFMNTPRVVIFPTGSTARFLFGGKVLVRFKKATRKGRGSNIPTAANDNFLDPTMPFADAPQSMKVEICWKVNNLGTGYDTVRVTARNGKGELWSYELPGGKQVVLEFPKVAAPQQPRRRSVAKLKDSAKGKKKRGEAS